MANIIITIPDDKLTIVVDSMCSHFGYTENQLPYETKEQFSKRMLIRSVKNVVREELTASALIAAKHAVDSEIDSINIS